jgi:hypothetical protein
MGGCECGAEVNIQFNCWDKPARAGDETVTKLYARTQLIVSATSDLPTNWELASCVHPKIPLDIVWRINLKIVRGPSRNGHRPQLSRART